jgi:hypothetical protein
LLTLMRSLSRKLLKLISRGQNAFENLLANTYIQPMPNGSAQKLRMDGTVLSSGHQFNEDTERDSFALYDG